MNFMRNTTKRRGGMAALNPTLRTGQSSQNSNTNSHTDTSHPQHFTNRSTSQRPKPKKGKSPRSRPTHFIAIPLNTEPSVLNHISAFQNALLEHSSPRQGGDKNRIRGLDPSIVIDPRRFHFTLGVMSLEDPAPQNAEAQSLPDEDVLATIGDPKPSPLGLNTSRPTCMVESALTLLRSLKPALMQIVSGSQTPKTSTMVDDRPSEAPSSTPSLRIVLDKIDIMDPVAPPKVQAKGKRGGVGGGSGQAREPTVVDEQDNDAGTGLEDNNLAMKRLEVAGDESHAAQEIWTKVLYVAPSFAGIEGEKLRRISDLVYQTFKRAGYLTDTRPLKLHCTVLNASKRRPSKLRGNPFAYSDILRSGTTDLLSPETTNTSPPDTVLEQTPTPTSTTGSQSTATTASPSNSRQRATIPPPVPIELGAEVGVDEIELWIMGSRGPNNEYVSCGGVELR